LGIEWRVCYPSVTLCGEVRLTKGVSFDGVPLTTSFVFSTQLTGDGQCADSQGFRTGRGVHPDGEVSLTFCVDIAAPQRVAVTISPTTVSLRLNRTRAVHGHGPEQLEYVGDHL